MKNTKIVALVAAVALLVLGTAFASFAATYNWYEQDGEWRCADKDGEDYYDTWAKSGDGWYYLGEEGYMLREALVETDKGTNYVDANGRMVTNDWKKVSNDDGDEFWMYFQSNGKAMKSKVAKIGENKYAFDDNGYMLSGWIDVVDGIPAAADDWKAAKYYYGDENDGAMKTGWQALTVDTTGIEDFDETEYWFYFKSNGQKYAATETDVKEFKINSKWYAFDEYGRMQAEWQTVYATDKGSISSYAWFQSVEIGAKFADGWFRVTPSADVDPDAEEDSVNWFYAKKGHLAYSEIKTINGKKYGFNAKGEMVSGLQDVETNELLADHNVTFTGIDTVAGVYGADGLVYYFSGDEENDGSMKTALQTVAIDDDPYSFYFDKKGYGITGNKSNKYYFNGIKVTANEDRADYMVFEALVDGEDGDKKPYSVKTDGYTFREAAALEIGGVLPAEEYAVISKTGVVASSGTKKDGNDWKAVFGGTKTTGFYWTISFE